MEIHEHFEDGILVVHVFSQIDSATGPELADRLDRAISEGNLHLILDASKVPYISSAGLRVLSLALKNIRDLKAGGDLYLAGLSKTVAHAFRISGFDQVFCIFDTVPEALAAMTASKDIEMSD